MSALAKVFNFDIYSSTNLPHYLMFKVNSSVYFVFARQLLICPGVMQEYQAEAVRSSSELVYIAVVWSSYRGSTSAVGHFVVNFVMAMHTRPRLCCPRMHTIIIFVSS